uniref:Uncharacterized protein n=1 Tax=Rhizophora mucronata TaxID=61149 RepID=A0A2P2Q296_RHIMU
MCSDRHKCHSSTCLQSELCLLCYKHLF